MLGALLEDSEVLMSKMLQGGRRAESRFVAASAESGGMWLIFPHYSNVYQTASARY
jgi:hypothetical protein